MARFTQQLMQMCEQKLRDPEIKRLIYDSIMAPLQEQITDGKLDAAIAIAIARITTPIIVLVAVLLILSIVQINMSVYMMRHIQSTRSI